MYIYLYLYMLIYKPGNFPTISLQLRSLGQVPFPAPEVERGRLWCSTGASGCVHGWNPTHGWIVVMVYECL